MNPLPDLQVTASDTLVQSGDQVQLNAVTNAVSVSWYPSTYLSCISCFETFSTPLDSITYLVTAVSNLGCKVSDTIKIYVDQICDEFFVPNLFSPNDDGANDVFCMYGTDCIDRFHLEIFDRWGNRVFESYDHDRCWDGTFKDRPLDPGVYVYKIDAVSYQGKIMNKQGNITLIR
jgi:gliding motility-associated-like protein